MRIRTGSHRIVGRLERGDDLLEALTAVAREEGIRA